MAGRDRQRDEDPDDWFDEPEPARDPALLHADREVPAPSADDWLSEEAARTSGERSFGAWIGRIDRRVAAAVASLVVLVLVALAAAGVFTGSRHRAATLPASTPTRPTTTTAASKPVAPPPAPSTTLKPGDHGAQVTTLQRALASLGFSPGKVDGVYGPATQRAVERFQRSEHLTPDGVLGPKTLRALVSALRGS
jgi:Putative peptidoglycan binding domain